MEAQELEAVEVEMEAEMEAKKALEVDLFGGGQEVKAVMEEVERTSSEDYDYLDPKGPFTNNLKVTFLAEQLKNKI